MMTRLTITKPDDMHLHLRDGDAMRSILAHTTRRFARAIIMPNLRTPITSTVMAIAYRQRIIAALPAGTSFEPLMTLYLTDNTAPQEIARAQASGIVHAVKYYRRERQPTQTPALPIGTLLRCSQRWKRSVCRCSFTEK
jgi:dihydroorotase